MRQARGSGWVLGRFGITWPASLTTQTGMRGYPKCSCVWWCRTAYRDWLKLYLYCSKIRQRILSWKNTSALWLHGYWSFDWADNYVKVDSVDKDSSAFVISSMTPPVYGKKDWSLIGSSCQLFPAFVLLLVLLCTNHRYHHRRLCWTY